MAPDADDAPSLDDQLEARAPGYRFGVVLLLLLVTFVFLASAPTDAWAEPVTVTLQSLTLYMVLVASNVSHRIRRAALVIVVIAIASSVLLPFLGDDARVGAFAIMSALLVAVAPVVITRSIVRRRVIDVHTVLGAICIYVFLGMIWAFVYTAIGAWGSEPFFAQHVTATSADYLYFSYVTLTTVGYGDLTAAGGLGRALAVLEALLGQIYLVTIVALLVSNLRRRDPSGPSTGPGPTGPIDPA